MLSPNVVDSFENVFFLIACLSSAYILYSVEFVYCEFSLRMHVSALAILFDGNSFSCLIFPLRGVHIFARSLSPRFMSIVTGGSLSSRYFTNEPDNVIMVGVLQFLSLFLLLGDDMLENIVAFCTFL